MSEKGLETLQQVGEYLWPTWGNEMAPRQGLTLGVPVSAMRCVLALPAVDRILSDLHALCDLCDADKLLLRETPGIDSFKPSGHDVDLS